MDNLEHKQIQTSESDLPEKKGTQKSRKEGKALPIIALLLALVTIGGMVYLWQQGQLSQKQMHAQINQLQKDLYQADELLDHQSEVLKILKKKSEALEQQNLQKESSYVLLEVNHLVNLSALHLMFENNATLARQLLEEADARLAEDEISPTLWPLRQAFAKDIAMLKAAPKVDVTGILSSLGTLSEQAEVLPDMPVSMTPVMIEKKSDEPTISADHIISAHAFLDKLKQLGSAIAHALSEMVIVSTNSRQVPYLLTAEQRLYVVTNIQSQLTLAQWAVVHRQQKIYDQSLSQIDHWLQRYFPTDQALVASMLKTLENLKTVVVSPATPTISRSLDALAHIKK